VIAPPKVKLHEKSVVGQEVQFFQHVCNQVVAYRLSIALIELSTNELYLGDAKIVNRGINLHVLFFREDNFLVSSGQVLFQFGYRFLSDICPFGVQLCSVVYSKSHILIII